MSTISAGTKFGLITVTGTPESRRNGVYYECQCDCGATMEDSQIIIYAKGYKAAGGNPDDIGLFIDGQALC